MRIYVTKNILFFIHLQIIYVEHEKDFLLLLYDSMILSALDSILYTLLYFLNLSIIILTFNV